jgi:hypothetical protein
MCKKYSRAAQATDNNMEHAHCMLDTHVYRHTFRKRNTYCFSTATMVTRTHLSVTLYVHCLFRFIFALPIPCVCKCYQRPYKLMLPRELISNVNLSIPHQSKRQPHSGVWLAISWLGLQQAELSQLSVTVKRVKKFEEWHRQW